jgi:cytochrome c
MKRAARAVSAALICCTTAACAPHEEGSSTAGGDPTRGRAAIERYGCGSCHVIGGIAGAGGNVGPSLEGVGRRAYLGGMLPNTPANMIAWIRNPRKFDPRTAMPDLGVSENEARDMAAYFHASR